MAPRVLATALLVASRAAVVGAGGALRGGAEANATGGAAVAVAGAAAGAREAPLGDASNASWGFEWAAAKPKAPEALLGDASNASSSLERAAAELFEAPQALNAWGAHGAAAFEASAAACVSHRRRRRPGCKTLYHTTSPEIAALILKTGFKPGHAGWCGGAIYFVDTPELPETKYGWYTKTGAIIEAKVDMGVMAHMDKQCTAPFGKGIKGALASHYNSLTFNPGDGDEYIIASTDRVLSMRLYRKK